MSHKVQELGELPTKELIAAHDRAAANVAWGVHDHLDEIARRDAKEVSEAIKQDADRVAAEVRTLYVLTQAAGDRMERLTRLIAVLTALAVIAAVAAIALG